MARTSASAKGGIVESLLNSRAGLETLLRETQNLIAFYQGCIDVDDAVRLNLYSAARIERVRNKVAKYSTWLPKNVAAFRPLKDLPPARWQQVNNHLPSNLRHAMELHRETVRDCRNAIESDSQFQLGIDDFAHRYGNHVCKAQDAIRGLVGVYEGFEAEICRRLEADQPVGKTTNEKKVRKPPPDRTQPWKERKDDAELFEKWQSFRAGTKVRRAMHRDFVETMAIPITEEESRSRVRAFREWLKALAESYAAKDASETDSAFARRRAKGMTASKLTFLLKMAEDEGF